MRNPSTYKSEAVEHIWIPKSNGKLRALSIFTMEDRTVQAVYLEIIDPIVKTSSCENNCRFNLFISMKDVLLSLRGK